MEMTGKSLEAFTEAAADFAKDLRPRSEGATLITLSGELGAGKTAFVKAAARALGVKEDVTSPTFVLLKSYDLPSGNEFGRLVHIDAYRLESGEQLTPLRFDEYMKDAANLIMLEWPEKLADALPVPAARIGIETLPDSMRRITYG